MWILREQCQHNEPKLDNKSLICDLRIEIWNLMTLRYNVLLLRARQGLYYSRVFVIGNFQFFTTELATNLIRTLNIFYWWYSVINSCISNLKHIYPIFEPIDPFPIGHIQTVFSHFISKYMKNTFLQAFPFRKQIFELWVGGDGQNPYSSYIFKWICLKLSESM